MNHRNKLFTTIIFCIGLCSCNDFGFVEKSKFDEVSSELENTKRLLNDATAKIDTIEREKNELSTRLETNSNELRFYSEKAETYKNYLIKACHEADNLEDIINNPDCGSFEELVKGVRNLKSALGYRVTYYNFSSDSYSSEQTITTLIPDYIYQ